MGKGPLILVKTKEENLVDGREYLVVIQWPGREHEEYYLCMAHWNSKDHPVEWRRNYWFFQAANYDFQLGGTDKAMIKEIYLLRRFG